MIRWKKSSKFLYLEPNQTKPEKSYILEKTGTRSLHGRPAVLSHSVNMAPNKSVMRASQEDAAFVWF